MTEDLNMKPGYRADWDGAYINLVDPEGRRVARLPSSLVAEQTSIEMWGNSKEPATRDQTAEQASVGASEGELSSLLRDFLRITRKRLWLVVLAAILIAGSTVGFSLARAPVYEASVKILVGQDKPMDRPFDSDQGALEGEIVGLQQLTQTMVEAVQTRPVAEASIGRLGLGMSPDSFLENMSVEQVHATQFVEVLYKDTNPERAQLIADTIGAVASERISEMSPSASIITAKVWERAALPEDPVSPNPVRDGLVALVVGAMLGVALAFLLEHWRDSWRSPAEAEQISGVPNFGVIPEFGAANGATPMSKGRGY